MKNVIYSLLGLLTISIILSFAKNEKTATVEYTYDVFEANTIKKLKEDLNRYTGNCEPVGGIFASSDRAVIEGSINHGSVVYMQAVRCKKN